MTAAQLGIQILAHLHGMSTPHNAAVSGETVPSPKKLDSAPSRKICYIATIDTLQRTSACPLHANGTPDIATTAL
jgi:hypothetical protein